MAQKKKNKKKKEEEEEAVKNYLTREFIE